MLPIVIVLALISMVFLTIPVLRWLTKAEVSIKHPLKMLRNRILFVPFYFFNALDNRFYWPLKFLLLLSLINHLLNSLKYGNIPST